MFHLVSGINSPYLFVNVILVSVPPFLLHGSSIPSPITSSSSDSPLCTPITPYLFHVRLKTYIFHKSYPRIFTSSSRTAFTDCCLYLFFWPTRFLFLFVSLFFRFCAVRYIKLTTSSAFEHTLIYRIVGLLYHIVIQVISCFITENASC